MSLKFRNKVCLIHNHFPPLYSGGSLQALSISTLLSNRWQFIAVGRGRGEGLPLIDNLNGVALFRLKYASKLMFSLRLFKWLCCHRSRYDIIHVLTEFSTGVTAIITSCILRKKCIVKLAMAPPQIVQQKRSTTMIRYHSLRLADCVIATTREMEYFLLNTVKIKQKRIIRIPNGVDTERFDPIKDETRRKALCRFLNINPERRIVSFVGLICERKGVDILLRSWPMVVKEFPDALLLLIGPYDGNYTDLSNSFIQWCHTFIADWKLDSNVIFTGRVHNIEQYLQASNAFVFPSRYEGLPNALMEAMSVGLPCVTAYQSGAEDLVDDKISGVIMKYLTPQSLAGNICALLNDADRSKQIGSKAREKMIKQFSLKSVADAYNRLYERLAFNVSGKSM